MTGDHHRAADNQKSSNSPIHPTSSCFTQNGIRVMNRKNSQLAFAKSRTPKIDIRQLRHAVIAADFGSFRQAADACLIKQPTLSRSIRQLEHCVGAPIFERSSGGITPTSAGRDFLRMARSILEQIDVVVATMRASGRGDTGGLAIGFCTLLRAICAPQYSILSSDSRRSLLRRSSDRGQSPRNCAPERGLGHPHRRGRSALHRLQANDALERAHFGGFAARPFSGSPRHRLLD